MKKLANAMATDGLKGIGLAKAALEAQEKTLRNSQAREQLLDTLTSLGDLEALPWPAPSDATSTSGFLEVASVFLKDLAELRGVQEVVVPLLDAPPFEGHHVVVDASSASEKGAGAERRTWQQQRGMIGALASSPLVTQVTKLLHESIDRIFVSLESATMVLQLSKKLEEVETGVFWTSHTTTASALVFLLPVYMLQPVVLQVKPWFSLAEAEPWSSQASAKCSLLVDIEAANLLATSTEVWAGFLAISEGEKTEFQTLCKFGAC